MAKTPEGVIVEYLCKKVREYPKSIQRKVTWQGRRGAPDRMVVINGCMGLFELKKPGGKLSKLQEVEIARLRDAGLKVFICDSTQQIDEALEMLWNSRQGPTNGY